MDKSNSKSDAIDSGDSEQENCRSIVFFLVPEFSMIAFASAIEVLRIANRMLGVQSYKWRLASLDGGQCMRI